MTYTDRGRLYDAAILRDRARGRPLALPVLVAVCLICRCVPPSFNPRSHRQHATQSGRQSGGPGSARLFIDWPPDQRTGEAGLRQRQRREAETAVKMGRSGNGQVSRRGVFS